MQPATMSQARTSRRLDRGELVGALLMVAVAAGPSVGYAFAGSVSLGMRAVFGTLQLLALLLMALVAPVVGWRRRDMWWTLLPFWGLVIAYRLGIGLVRRGRGEEVSERFPHL